MQKKLKKISLFVLSITFAFSLLFGVIGSADKVYAQDEIMATTEIFKPSDIKVSPAQLPEGVSVLKPGCLLTSTDRNNEVELKNAYSGNFSYMFEPVKNQGTVNIKTFDTVFTDESGASFTLRLSYGTNNYASVIFDGIQVGINHSITSTRYNCTEYANSNGVYSPFDCEEVSVVFNPELMTISVGADGGEKVVWDFSSSVNDGYDVGKTLNVFTKYFVSFVINDFKGDTCSVLLRRINDSILDGIIIQSTGKPSIFVDFVENAVSGNTYVLPKAVATDVWDGELETYCEVYAPNGKLIAQNVSRFVPIMEGDYQIKYYAENKRGDSASKIYTIKSYDFENIPEYTINLDSSSLDKGTSVVGEKLYVPKMTLTEGLNIKGAHSTNLTVKLNGIVIGNYSNIPGGFNYEFRKDGVYEFCYDAGFSKLISYFITVENRSVYLSADLKDTYLIGDMVDLRSAKMFIDNSEVNYSISVEYPNGKVYATPLFECTEMGKYTVTATCQVNGVKYSAIECFEVNKNVDYLFESISENVTAEYGKSSFTGKEGVVLNFSGAKLSANYKNAIDISKYKNQRELRNGTYGISENAIPLISLSINPASYGVASTSEFYVNLTDAENPNNVLSVVLSGTESSLWTYLRAKAGEQDYVGFNNDLDRGTSWFNGQKGNFYTGRYGLAMGVSFAGNIQYFAPENQLITLYYDDVEKQILAKPAHNATTSNWIVCDFDDPACCNGAPWGGFTSDKVYLSVQSGTLKTNQAGITVYEVDGTSFENSQLIYDEKPTIKLNETYVYGIKGYSVKVPTVSAVDKYGDRVSVVSKAYFFNNGNYYDVKIKSGKFLTDKSGTYKIVYTAIDFYGNTSSKSLTVEVVDNVSDINIEFNGIPSDGYVSGKVGSNIEIYKDLYIDNAMGETTTETTVYINGETLVVTDGSFLPTKVGTYMVTHKVIDAFGRVSNELSYTVEIEQEINPIASSTIPTYFGFVRGNTYSLLDVYAIDYTESETPVKADVYVNGVKNADGKFKADTIVEEKDVAEKEETVVIEYKVGDKTVFQNGNPLVFEVPLKTVYKNVTIQYGSKPMDVKTYLLERYFDIEQMTITKGNYLQFKPIENYGTATLLQPLSSKNLSFRFDIADEKSSEGKANEPTTSEICFIITDQLDCTKQIVIMFKAEDGTTEVYVNGVKTGAKSTLGGLLYGLMNDAVEIKYDARNGVLSELNSKIEIANLSTFSDGSKFTGFSDNVYISISIKSAQGKQSNGISLMSINSQIFAGLRISDDTYAPNIVLNGTLGGSFIVGERYTIPSVTANDVLSDIDYDSLTVTVKLNGKAINDVNGKTLNNVSANKEWIIELSETGKYIVTYNVKDARSGVMAPKEYVLSVRIDQEPVIEKVEIQSTVKKGEKIKVPTPNVTFSVDSDENTFYAIYVAPDNTHQWINTDSEFVADKTGTYKIRFMAIDAYGNSAYVEYLIICHK